MVGLRRARTAGLGCCFPPRICQGIHPRTKLLSIQGLHSMSNVHDSRMPLQHPSHPMCFLPARGPLLQVPPFPTSVREAETRIWTPQPYPFFRGGVAPVSCGKGREGCFPRALSPFIDGSVVGDNLQHVVPLPRQQDPTPRRLAKTNMNMESTYDKWFQMADQVCAWMSAEKNAGERAGERHGDERKRTWWMCSWTNGEE